MNGLKKIEQTGAGPVQFEQTGGGPDQIEHAIVGLQVLLLVERKSDTK